MDGLNFLKFPARVIILWRRRHHVVSTIISHHHHTFYFPTCMLDGMNVVKGLTHHVVNIKRCKFYYHLKLYKSNKVIK